MAYNGCKGLKLKMKFAIVDNVRREAEPELKGLCPVCNAECIAKCGQSKINHWAHKSKKNCDKWWETETLWHRLWKNKFPKEWQEVPDYDQKTGEKHVADVKTDTGLVIEFQHSPISSEERESREKFHKAMVWVANIVTKRDRKRFEEFPIHNTNFFLMGRMDIPERWCISKVPVLFDLTDVEKGYETDTLFCMLPQTIDWYKRFIMISKQDFINKANDGTLKQFLHDLMVDTMQYCDKRKAYEQLENQISDTLNVLWDYADNFKGVTRNLNVSNVKNTKGWIKLGNYWFIPGNNNTLLKVDSHESCEYTQQFPLCNSSIGSIMDYYNRINSSKELIYKGQAYNGEECAGYPIAKYFDKEDNLLYVICRESKGAFVKKIYKRDYGYYQGKASSEWLKCPKVPCSYNLLIVGLQNGKFIHVHKFDLANWLMEHDYEIL